jgi:hypothetical protein
VPAATDGKKGQDNDQKKRLPGSHRLAPLSTRHPRAWHRHRLEDFVQNGR